MVYFDEDKENGYHSEMGKTGCWHLFFYPEIIRNNNIFDRAKMTVFFKSQNKGY